MHLLKRPLRRLSRHLRRKLRRLLRKMLRVYLWRSPQIIVIQATPETAPTPEPTIVPTIWDKPFNDYSPTEGLLLVIFVALCFTALLIWLR